MNPSLEPHEVKVSSPRLGVHFLVIDVVYAHLVDVKNRPKFESMRSERTWELSIIKDVPNLNSLSRHSKSEFLVVLDRNS